MHTVYDQRRFKLTAILFFLIIFISPQSLEAHGSGEAMDNVADAMSWVALILGPVIAITVFLLVHVMPEKIAEKRNHPQAQAIKILCLLSLVFGGLLWPLAWLWAYSKPVLYKMAYGTDKGDYHEPTFNDLHDTSEKKSEGEEQTPE